MSGRAAKRPTAARAKPTARKPTAAKARTAKAAAKKPARKRAPRPEQLAVPEPRDLRTGRRTKLTAEVREEVVKAVRIGVPLETAALHAGIGRSTLYSWTQRGRRERARLDGMQAEGIEPLPLATERPYLDFLDRVEGAEAMAEVYAVATLRDLMAKTNDGQVRARAATTLLERRWPQRYSRRERHDVVVAGAPDAPIEVNVREDQRERTTAILAVLLDSGALSAAGLALPAADEAEEGEVVDGDAVEE